MKMTRKGFLSAVTLICFILITVLSNQVYADSYDTTIMDKPIGNVLYTQPEGMASAIWYTSVIRLEHNENEDYNGRLLATFFNGYNEKGECAIYMSEDDGYSWTGPISYVKDTQRENYVLWEPRFFELPEPCGDLPKGTIFLATRSFGPPGTWYFGCEIMLYYSTDGGKTWNYRSSVAYSEPFGTYEPHLAIAADGSLVCYYADETTCDEGDQVIGHKVSKDGGLTWGPFVTDVARKGKRPGMPTVVKLPSGQYAMSFEVVRDGASRVYVKFSDDGLDWGDPEDFGNPVQTASGAYSGACPYMTWVPGNGGNGYLVVSSSFLVNSPLENRQIYVNNNLGKGEWHMVNAPVQWQGYEENHSQGYVQAMIPTADGKGVIHFASSFVSPKQNEIRYGKTTLLNVTEVDDNTLYFIKNHYSSLNLDNANGQIVNGKPVRQWNQNRQASQLWSFEMADKVGDTSYYYIYSVKEIESGFEKTAVLDVKDGSHNNDAQVYLWEYTGGESQQWQLVPQSDGSLLIKNRNSGKVIDMSISQEPGTLAKQYESLETATQKWYLTPYSEDDIYPHADPPVPSENDETPNETESPAETEPPTETEPQDDTEDPDDGEPKDPNDGEPKDPDENETSGDEDINPKSGDSLPIIVMILVVSAIVLLCANNWRRYNSEEF